MAAFLNKSLLLDALSDLNSGEGPTTPAERILWGQESVMFLHYGVGSADVEAAPKSGSKIAATKM
jgi:hypothetical protein